MRFPRRWIPAASAVLLLVASPVLAQNTASPPPTRDAIHQSFAPIVKKAAPAVVNVYSRRVVRNQSPLLNDPIFRRLFGNELQRLG